MKKYELYKPSGAEWIGNIPEDWDFVRIGFISNLLTGNPWSSELFDLEEGIKIVRGDNVSEGFLRWGDKTRFWKHEIIKDKTYFLEDGDVVISMDGSKVGKNFVLISNSDLPLLLHQRMCRVRVKQSTLPKFLTYLVGSQMFRYYIDISKTEPMIPHITQKDISDFYFPLPPVNEQQQIVEFLDHKTSIIDSLTQKKQRKIELLKEHRKSIINNAVTKGLNPNVKMRDSGVEWIDEVPEHWEVKKMKYFAKICNGRDYKEFVLEEGGYPVYGTGGIFSRCSHFLYDKVSVLLGRKGSVDRPQIVYEPFWTSDTTYYTEIKDNVSPVYFFHLVNQINFERYIYGAAIPSMTKSVYDDMALPCPTFHEQQQIVEYLDHKTTEIDTQINLENRKIDLLKEFRQSLISEVVTGKIDVRKN